MRLLASLALQNLGRRKARSLLLIMAVAVGWWFFGDFPDAWTFVGVAVLIGCALYISVRERRVVAESPHV